MPMTMKFNSVAWSPPKAGKLLNTSYVRRSTSLDSYRATTGSEASSARTNLGSPNGSGAEDAKALASRAETLARAGNIEEAEALYRKAVAANEEQLAAAAGNGGVTARDSILMDALRASAGLARLLRMQGAYDEAESIYRSSLARAEGWLGPSHPGTLKVTNFLALLLSEIDGRGEEAALLFKRALLGFESGAGPTHPDTLSIVSNLANLHADLGELDEAASLYRRAVAGLAESLGPQHPATCSSRNGLATLLAEKGELESAMPLCLQALEGFEASLGAGHPETLSCVHTLATMRRDAGAPRGEAEPLFQRALAGRGEALGPRHPATLATVHGYAGLLRAQGDAAAADALLARHEQASG